MNCEEKDIQTREGKARDLQFLEGGNSRLLNFAAEILPNEILSTTLK